MLEWDENIRGFEYPNKGVTVDSTRKQIIYFLRNSLKAKMSGSNFGWSI